MSSVTFEELSARIAILEAIVTDNISKGNKGKQVKTSLKKDGTERKKRTLSAYQIFCNENRAEVQAELLEQAGSEVKLARGAVLSELGSRWKSLGEEERKKWTDKCDMPNISCEGEKKEIKETTEEEVKVEIEQKINDKVEDEVNVEVDNKKEKKDKKDKKTKKIVDVA